MTKCNYCKLESPEPVGYLRKFCDDCVKEKEIGVPVALGYTFLEGYGKVLNTRIGEMSRRAVVKDKSDPTGYHCGRLGENGKISEREPNY